MSFQSEISQEVFLREIKICRKLNREGKKGWNWGKCANCGVLPLLIKLRKGELLEELKEIEKTKKHYLD